MQREDTEQPFVRLNAKRSTLGDYQDQLDSHAHQKGGHVSDKTHGPGRLSSALASWSAIAFSSAAMMVGMAHAPEAKAHQVQQHIQPAQTNQIESAYAHLTDALGWKTLVDEGVSQNVKASMLPKNQLFLTIDPSEDGRFVQAMSRAQAMLGAEATAQERAAVGHFNSAVINSLESPSDRLNLRRALDQEAALTKSRLQIRDALASFMEHGGSAEDIQKAGKIHADALRAVGVSYESVAEGGSPLADSALNQSKEAFERMGIVESALSKLDSAMKNGDQHSNEFTEAVELAALEMVENDLGQRLPTKEEFILAARDADGNVLPGAYNLDEPPAQAGSERDRYRRMAM